MISHYPRTNLEEQGRSEHLLGLQREVLVRGLEQHLHHVELLKRTARTPDLFHFRGFINGFTEKLVCFSHTT